MKIFLLFCFLLVVSHPGYALVEPKIASQGDQKSLKLGKDVRAALKKFDPFFKVLKNSNHIYEIESRYHSVKKQIPMAVVEHFNEDKVKDVVVMGVSQSSKGPKVRVILVVSGKKNYKAFFVQEWQSNRYIEWLDKANGKKELSEWPFYLKKLAEEEVSHLAKAKLLNVPKGRKAFKILNARGSAHPYYFNKNQVYTFSKTPIKKKKDNKK